VASESLSSFGPMKVTPTSSRVNWDTTRSIFVR
jgi:hypothetical protein